MSKQNMQPSQFTLSTNYLTDVDKTKRN